LRDRCNELLRSGVPVNQVARWLRGWLVIVQITRSEADELDHYRGLKTVMPATWKFETGCLFERLHVAGIDFHRPQEFKSACAHGLVEAG
jgi:hypothetical protein